MKVRIIASPYRDVAVGAVGIALPHPRIAGLFRVCGRLFRYYELEKVKESP